MESPPTGLMSQPGESVAGAVTPERAAYYERIGKKNLAPLWEVLKGLVPPEPKTPCVPAFWRFDDVKKLVLEAGDADHRRGSRAPRAGAGKSRACAASRASPNRSMPACS